MPNACDNPHIKDPQLAMYGCLTPTTTTNNDNFPHQPSVNTNDLAPVLETTTLLTRGMQGCKTCMLSAEVCDALAGVGWVTLTLTETRALTEIRQAANFSQ